MILNELWQRSLWRIVEQILRFSYKCYPDPLVILCFSVIERRIIIKQKEVLAYTMIFFCNFLAQTITSYQKPRFLFSIVWVRFVLCSYRNSLHIFCYFLAITIYSFCPKHMIFHKKGILCILQNKKTRLLVKAIKSFFFNCNSKNLIK